MLKCSRCRHIFPAERTQRAPGASPRETSAPRAPSRDLDLAFDEGDWEGEQPDLTTPHEDEVFSLDSDDDSARHRADAEPRLLSERDAPHGDSRRSLKTIETRDEAHDNYGQSYRFDDDELHEVTFDSEADAPARAKDEDDGDDEVEVEEDDAGEFEDEEVSAEAADDAGPEEDVRRSRAWAVPLILFFSIVVACYFLLARELISDRAFAEDFVAKLPMVGSSLAADRLLFRKVALSDIDGSFVRVKQGKEVFVISGSALNTASRSLRNIRIEGTLIDSSGRALQEETITCGGMDARRLLQGLSLREVEMLGKVEPSRTFHLDPGESTNFAIVFTNPPATATDFTARVASAQR